MAVDDAAPPIFPSSKSPTAAQEFRRVTLGADGSLIDQLQKQNAPDARYTALRALGLGHLAGIGDLCAERMAMADDDDASDSASTSREGLADFKAHVIDDLIAMLSGVSPLLGDDFAMSLDPDTYDPQSVVSVIFNTDSSEWANDPGDPIDSADPSAASDGADTFDTRVLADIAGGSGPTMFGSSTGRAAYTGGHLADFGALVHSTHNFVATNSFDGFEGNTFPKIRLPSRAARHHAVHLNQQPPAAGPPASPLVVAPLPPSAYSGLAMLGLLAGFRFLKRRNAPEGTGENPGNL